MTRQAKSLAFLCICWAIIWTIQFFFMSESRLAGLLSFECICWTFSRTIFIFLNRCIVQDLGLTDLHATFRDWADKIKYFEKYYNVLQVERTPTNTPESHSSGSSRTRLLWIFRFSAFAKKLTTDLDEEELVEILASEDGAGTLGLDIIKLLPN